MTEAVSYLSSYAVHATTMRRLVVSLRCPRLVGRGLHHVVVEGALDLEHQDPAVGQVPLGVGEAQPARAVAPRLLGPRRCHAEGRARATQVALGQGVNATADVQKEGAELS